MKDLISDFSELNRFQYWIRMVDINIGYWPTSICLCDSDIATSFCEPGNALEIDILIARPTLGPGFGQITFLQEWESLPWVFESLKRTSDFPDSCKNCSFS